MLAGKVCAVTGASRGVGRGVALGLGAAGATVYVTGRSAHEGDAPLPGTVYKTAEEVNQKGGKGIAVICDHSDDEQVQALFEQVRREHEHLDILVNCAITLPAGLTDPGPFWNKSLALTEIFNVGMRSAYVASYYAAPLMLERQSLIVHISSPGGQCYMHGPAYGAGKAATDKMAHDMAHDFRPFGVSVVSLWPGIVKTERTLSASVSAAERYGEILAQAETPEFVGRVISALYQDKARQSRSGQVFYTAELAQEYGITDEGGFQPPSHRAYLGGPPVFSAAVVE